MKFPSDTSVTEGEGVYFRIKVSGEPQPIVTWYHDGEPVRADYACEIESDGSLAIPSAELKHSGVYKAVAENKHGSEEREIKLMVSKEGGAASTAVAVDDVVSSGVYKAVAESRHGSEEREIKLMVSEEGGAASTAVAVDDVVSSRPIPIPDFGEYIAKLHANSNQGFKDLYEVGTSVHATLSCYGNIEVIFKIEEKLVNFCTHKNIKLK